METFIHKDHDGYLVLNGNIKTTSNHPFYSDGNWIEAGNLSVGDKILHVDGLEHTVETIELSDESATVYNFEVDGTHNYFAEGYLVHNKMPPSMDPPGMPPTMYPPPGMPPTMYPPPGMPPSMYPCFVGGTLVQLPNGIKYIEDIEVGDMVKSFDVGTSSTVNSKVTETYVHSDRDYMIINGIIKTTSVHPFYSDGKWIEAGDLSVGDKILHVDGLEHTIETIKLSDEPVTVYNFEVDGTHNYFAEGYLVHNKGPSMFPFGA